MPFALADVSHGGALRSGLAICAPGRSKHRSTPRAIKYGSAGRALRNPPRKEASVGKDSHSIFVPRAPRAHDEQGRQGE